jgi:hypothetical protein
MMFRPSTRVKNNFFLLFLMATKLLALFVNEAHSFNIGTTGKQTKSSITSSLTKHSNYQAAPATLALFLQKQSASPKATNNASSTSNRRDWIQNQTILSILMVATTIAGGVVAPIRVEAADDEEEDEINPDKVSRMGGQLEKFQDGTRGFRMLAPSGWNKFEGEVGAYDIMWRDLVDVRENIKISTIPVKSTTTSV